MKIKLTNANDSVVVVKSDGTEIDITNNIVSTTYANLKTFRDGGNLIVGKWYRITNFVTTTAADDTQSAGHAFDIIVFAESANKLNEEAYAVLHAGDSYFANSNLSAWKLKYCLDNDTNRFEWADTTNGKGVVYYMNDEFGNECPYDFKNILFKVGANAQAGTKADVFYYTFSKVVGGIDQEVYDHSLNGDYCHNNTMGEYKSEGVFYLNRNVFRNTNGSSLCYDNAFGDDCFQNIFGDNCYGNIFNVGCYSNTFAHRCCRNTFAQKCDNNTFGNSCQYNTFGNSCYGNALDGGCCYNTLLDYCNYNSFGLGNIGNTFGYSCIYNTFGKGCHDNTIDPNCSYNTFGNDFSGKHVTYSHRLIDTHDLFIHKNDEVYQIKDNTLFPVSHPDLSTQPSILPQRYGNLPIKEVLIANGRENEIPKDAMVIEAFSFNKTACVPACVKYDEKKIIPLFKVGTGEMYGPNTILTLKTNYNLYEYGIGDLDINDSYNNTTYHFLKDYDLQTSGDILASGDAHIGEWEIIDVNTIEFHHYIAGEIEIYEIVQQFSQNNKSWHITNSENITPDFTIVRYVGADRGYYYEQPYEEESEYYYRFVSVNESSFSVVVDKYGHIFGDSYYQTTIHYNYDHPSQSTIESIGTELYRLAEDYGCNDVGAQTLNEILETARQGLQEYQG